MSPNRQTCFLPQEEFDRLRGQYAKFNEPWSASEIEELKVMAEDNVPFAEIANQLQRTPNSIKLKLKSLGLYTPAPPPRGWTEEEDAALVGMYEGGDSFDAMAEAFDRSVSAVVSRLVKLRVSLFGQAPSPPG